MNTVNPISGDGDSRPVPDPTVLTTQQLEREISSLRNMLSSRMDSMDEATDLRLERINSMGPEMRREIAHLTELIDQRFSTFEEKFKTIDTQFKERDVRTDKAATASADALAAALQAAKELVGAQGEASAAAAVKSETSFTKQIDQIGTIIQTQATAQDARITELKERIDRGEGNQSGVRDQTDASHANANVLIGALSVLLVVVGLIITVILATQP